MRKATIGVGIILVLLIGMIAQASAQKIHCWDLNRNGSCDASTEDINGDGKCNSRDCQGEPEPVCISCWDLDGDGNCDLDEDRNGDTICDAYDCQGINCWDLNQNRSCDTSTEDINGDGNCDVLDCRGEPGIGAVQVYDSKSPPQYLGSLIDLSWVAHIFIPSLKKMIAINVMNGDAEFGPSEYGPYYEFSSCSGTPYLFRPDWIVKDCDGKYLVSSQTAVSISIASQCVPNPPDPPICSPGGGEETYFEATEIPVEDIPFILPVVLPLQYQ